MATQSICEIVDTLSDFQLQIMRYINGKFLALRRLADLMEAFGDLTVFLPDVSRLIPISQIDLTTYAQLRAACPDLGLPEAGAVGDALGDLRAAVNGAYAEMYRILSDSSFARMGRLQEELDSARRVIDEAMLKGANYLGCAQALCDAYKEAGTLISATAQLSYDDIEAVVTDYTNNIVNANGQVLTDAAKQKVDQVNAAAATLEDLMDVDDLPALPTFSG